MKNVFKNNLFIKICLSFWLTTLFMIASVVTVDWLTDTGPFHSKRHPMNEAGIRTQFPDENGNGLIGKPGEPGPPLFPADAPKFGGAGPLPPENGGRDAMTIPGSGGKPPAMAAERRRWPPPPPPDGEPLLIMTVVRVLVLLTVSGLICYLLARYLTTPILKIGSAAQRLAAGDLSVRVGPGLGKRRDEISRLAVDFDAMAERLESLLNSQRVLLRDISHELRSPLARLNVALELCRKGCHCEVQKYLERIERESGRLNEMIGHLLTLNRVESGIDLTQKKRIDMSDLIREIVEDADFEAKGHNRSVTTTLIETCFVEGDEVLLRRALDNVARNAVRYTADGSAVEVSLSHIRDNENSRCLITVRDHGQGVPEAAIPLLFKPFYRVSEGRERETGGTGLGLAITEAAVRLHGGTVRAANSCEGGLIVEISLPVLS